MRTIDHGFFALVLSAVPATAVAQTAIISPAPPAIAPALADDSAFLKCDGYPQPTKKGDSLTTSGWMFGLASTTTDQRRSSTRLGDAGAAACDRALAHPLLLATFTMRRAHLLQSKGAHLIAAGKFADALGSLAQSDAVGRSEPLFDQSLGQGNRALRALAYHGLGKSADANLTLDEMEQRRPWATSQRQLAMKIRVQFDDDRQRQVQILEQMAPLFPGAKHQLFWMSMLFDDWQAALKHAQGVSYANAKDHGNWRGALDDLEKYLDVIEAAKFSGALAYAQFAGRKKEASAATMAKAKADVEATMTPLPPLAPGQSYSKREKLDYERRVLAGKRALELLKDWSGTITLRADAPTLTVDEIKKRITDDKLKVPTVSDILANAKADTPAATAAKQAILKELYAERDAARLKANKMSFETLVTMLPRPETMKMGVRYRREDGIIGSGLDGYAVSKNNPAGANTVRFGSGRGSLAAVDEGVMFAAAQFAQSAGKDSFVIDTREPIQRTIHYYGMYSGGGQSPSGYEVRLVVRPVNAADAAPGDRDRLVSAAKVSATLAPRLVVPVN